MKKEESVIINKQTLFGYVYENLKEQILTGRLQYGEKLPSMNRLCEFYQVGIRTVKDVMHALKQEGYIATEERKAATVIYRQADRDMAMMSVLDRKSSIIAVYQTISILAPVLLSFSAQLCEDGELNQVFHSQMRIRGTDPEGIGRVCDCCIYVLLKNSNNLLFRDLYSSLEVYARMSFFRNYSRCMELVAERSECYDLRRMMKAYSAGNPSDIAEWFRTMFQSVAHAVGQYLDEMSEAYGEAGENSEEGYSWHAEYGKEHYYMQIVRELVRKIGTGVYQAGTFLPSEAELAAQYGVCVSTIRNAIAALNQMGLGETLNARGTRIVRPERDIIQKCMKNKNFRKYALGYLSSLQLLAVIIRPAASSVADQITEAERRELQELQSGQETALLDKMLQCVIEHQTLPPLRAVLQETRRLSFRGYYLFFLDRETAGAEPFNGQVLSARDHLTAGDAEGFSEALSRCYGCALDLVRSVLTEAGLAEAERIVTP